MGEFFPLVFMVMIAGFVVLGVGLNVFQKWAKSRITGGETTERLALMEEHLAELEERLDFTERALTDLKTRRRLEPGEAANSSDEI